MSLSLQKTLHLLKQRSQQMNLLDQRGVVTQTRGLILESLGPDAALGDIVYIEGRKRSERIAAEVVGFRDKHILMMPLEDVERIHPGASVRQGILSHQVPVGTGLMGRILNGLGEPIDGKGPLDLSDGSSMDAKPPCATRRAPIRSVLETQIKAIDTFLPLGVGQRMGIFAGSGVGKSTLLGMIAQGAQADVNVIALIGERGRELGEFIERDLGPEGLAKSVLIVSTSDQMAPMRIRAAKLATRIAEIFRDEGKGVLFLMDSVTRLAMAQREIGLSVGEPPTTRGYTPSVFSLLPKLLERTGNAEKGSITALYTVLVEADELNEPISDAVRGILDGHIVLSRDLASRNQFPSIDIASSVSRLVRSLCNPDQYALLAQARECISLYERNEDLITLGSYDKDGHSPLSKAVAHYPKLMNFLAQAPDETVTAQESWRQLAACLSA